MTEPHPTALARHTQPTRNESLPLDELHRLAGRYDRYPSPSVPEHTCPVCGGAVPALATYCGEDCRKTAQKRLANASFARREADEIPGYSYPIPRKR